ncbi:MAG: cadmium-translocating P-type ATPase [Spirochaetaceae bacterium]|nr:MAG: cadmium-translocating P-type ATPase [Spirochaetaceae bacterium]
MQLHLDIPVVIPKNEDCAHCRLRLQEMAARLKGIDSAELSDLDRVLRVRFDPNLTSASAIEEEVRSLGIELEANFAHDRLHLEGLDCADCASTIEKMLSRKDGILWAAVNFPAATMEVEYDPRRIDVNSISREIEHLGYTAASPTPDHRHSEVFYIPEMDCDEEIALIRKKLSSLEGVLDLEFNLVSQKLTVFHKTSSARIEAALREIKMTPRREKVEPEQKRGFWATHKRLILTILSGLLTVTGLLLSRTGVDPTVTIPVYVAAMLSGGWLVARKGFYALRNRTLDINVLMSLAVIGAAAIGEWLEGATVIFLFSLANLLESYSMNRARRSIESLMDLAPNIARVRAGAVERTVPVEEVQIGDILAVRPGERVPLDGTVVEGSSEVDQSPITGESLPVSKAGGDEVFGGTINGGGYLEIRVTRHVRDTTLSRIVHSVEEAHSRKAPSQSFVDRFARYYTPAIVLIAALMALLPPLIAGAAWGVWFYRALVLLVVACPCALVISTPVTIVSALARATRDGILFKGGVFLEAIGTLKAFAFDKTGTLTYGKLALSTVVALNGSNEGEVLRLASGIESRSEHHLAGAILAEARDRGIEAAEASEFLAMPGKGAAATIEGRRYYIGNHRLFEEMGWCYPELDARLDVLEKQGNTAVILGDGRIVLGILGVSDQPRSESSAALASLKQLGIQHTVLLTGDNRSTADAIAERIGIEACRSELLPEDKVAAVRELVDEYGSAAMVGDGVNDAPALATATVGIAMGVAGTDAALETADVALMSDDLSKLPLAVRLGRRALRLVKQNIAFSILLKLVFIALTPLGLTTLWMAVLADMGASLLVIFNGLRALGKRV